MLPRSVVSSAIVLGVLVLADVGHAEQRRPPPAGEETPEVLPPAGGGGSSGSGPATDVPEKKLPSTPAAGYAYGDKATASSRSTPHARYRTRGPVVNIPGFEQTADGGSRLFVQLSQSVPVEERKGQGTITYVLKGASPRVWNNTNALVTVHFNTPVSRARLVPQGQDVHFIVELRSAATPTWKMTESADKSALLTIDFPKGDFLQSGVETPPSDEQAPIARAAPKAGRSKQGGKKPAPAPAKKEPAAGAPNPGPKP
jgi:hypothetical protein